MKKLDKKIREKLQNITLIVSDVDGVLTDGRVYLDHQGKEIKVFCARDGFRIDIWLRGGKKMLWFTGRRSAGIVQRAKELGVDLVFKDEIKGDLFAYVQKKYHLSPEKILYVGDDWSDLYYMGKVAVSVSPANGSAENLAVAHMVTTAKGGEGVLAEIIEQVLRAQGTWDTFVAPYQKKFIL